MLHFHDFLCTQMPRGSALVDRLIVSYYTTRRCINCVINIVSKCPASVKLYGSVLKCVPSRRSVLQFSF